MQKLGTTEVPSRFSQSFPAQGDKENIEGKDVSVILTAHQKHLNKGKFYTIPTIKNQISLRQLNYLGKIFCREDSHILTRLLTVWCDHPRKVSRPILTNKPCMGIFSTEDLAKTTQLTKDNLILDRWDVVEIFPY